MEGPVSGVWSDRALSAYPHCGPRYGRAGHVDSAGGGRITAAGEIEHHEGAESERVSRW